MKIIQKTLGLAIAGALILGSAMSVSAATINIQGNGSDSYNKVKIHTSRSNYVSQSSYTNNYTDILVKQNTGGNEVEDNTGNGNINITSGNINTNVSVSNVGSVNVLEGDDCGCVEDPELDVDIKGNGTDSTNKVEFSNYNRVTKKQRSSTHNTTFLTQYANTGKNEVEDNTSGDGGSDIDVRTGRVRTNIVVSNLGSANQQ